MLADAPERAPSVLVIETAVEDRNSFLSTSKRRFVPDRFPPPDELIADNQVYHFAAMIYGYNDPAQMPAEFYIVDCFLEEQGSTLLGENARRNRENSLFFVSP
jgi:hypothetical protein